MNRILVENFATTDVTPGTYHVTTSLGGDLGWHTVRAGQITYVGLFPVWLPFVMSNSSTWNSTITVRNNSAATAQAFINYYSAGGAPVSSQTQVIDSNEAEALTMLSTLEVLPEPRP